MNIMRMLLRLKNVKCVFRISSCAIPKLLITPVAANCGLDDVEMIALHICEESSEKYLKSSLGSTFIILQSNLLRAGQMFIMMKLYRGINIYFYLTFVCFYLFLFNFCLFLFIFI